MGKVFCCLSEHKGCPTTPVTTTQCPFDCTAGFNDLSPQQWVKGWSGEKKIYCCRTAHRGCPTELPPPSGIPPSGAPPAPGGVLFGCAPRQVYPTCPHRRVRHSAHDWFAFYATHFCSRRRHCLRLAFAI